MEGYSQAELLKMVRIDIILNDIAEMKLEEPPQKKAVPVRSLQSAVKEMAVD